MMDELQTARTLLAQTCGVLKVFPLPGAVVLPGTPAPFHIFEPRYRAMTADALAGDRLLAVATLVSEEGAVQDRAPVHPVAGAGIIEADERRPRPARARAGAAPPRRVGRTAAGGHRRAHPVGFGAGRPRGGGGRVGAG